jgi:hypothetical protein
MKRCHIVVSPAGAALGGGFGDHSVMLESRHFRVPYFGAAGWRCFRAGGVYCIGERKIDK